MTVTDPRTIHSPPDANSVQLTPVGAGSSSYHDQSMFGSNAHARDVVVGPAPEPTNLLASSRTKAEPSVQDLTEDTPMDEFDLSALVRQILAGTDVPDNTTLANMVYRAIPRKDHSAALRQALRVYVGNMVSLNRKAAMSSTGLSPTRTPYPPASSPAGNSPIPDHKAPLVTNKGKGRSRPYAGEGQHATHTVAHIHKRWELLVHSRLSVGPGKDNSKLFGDCEQDDLQYAKEYCARLASANAAKSERYERVAGLLVEHNVKRVRDLPEHVLVGVFAGVDPVEGDVL